MKCESLLTPLSILPSLAHFPLAFSLPRDPGYQVSEGRTLIPVQYTRIVSPHVIYPHFFLLFHFSFNLFLLSLLLF
ncbi:hypothetical protein IE53DRAFT_148444 [Violaceomyces palustris]|uniref:Uncharacterized protein n=1 Tax=Violaceomyces palustris TaxID=1673888 RepID=A0ACD0NU67_9BASI|nr:hypothetical protein IE53DRAFT_148444 [Violaceomyces palustris]